jgi:hypothetical protein
MSDDKTTSESSSKDKGKTMEKVKKFVKVIAVACGIFAVAAVGYNLVYPWLKATFFPPVRTFFSGLTANIYTHLNGALPYGAVVMR